MSTLAPDRQMLSVRDVARVLSVSEKTVRRLVHREQGALPALRVGGSIRVDPDALQRWLFEDPATAVTASAGNPVGRCVPGSMRHAAPAGLLERP